MSESALEKLLNCSQIDGSVNTAEYQPNDFKEVIESAKQYIRKRADGVEQLEVITSQTALRHLKGKPYRKGNGGTNKTPKQPKKKRRK